MTSDDRLRLTDGGRIDWACETCGNGRATHVVLIHDPDPEPVCYPNHLSMCQDCLQTAMDGLAPIISARSGRDNLGQITIPMDEIAQLTRTVSRLLDSPEWG